MLTTLGNIRMPNDAEPLPEELRAPIAVADDLLLPAAAPGEAGADQVDSAQQVKAEADEKSSASERSSKVEDSPRTVSISSTTVNGNRWLTSDIFLSLTFYQRVALCLVADAVAQE